MNEQAGDDSPTFYIGTSGWSYDHWRGNFYPQGLAKNRWFDFYTEHFNAVEINATFYGSFKDQTYLNWKAHAPPGFGYVLKAPQLITHRKLLRNVEADIETFWRSASLLEDKFECILLQVAPSLPHDYGLLRGALQAFPDPGRVAVEFRDEWWHRPETEQLLSSVGAVFCNVDSPGRPMTEILTSERAYLRLHGRRRWYASDYSAAELAEMAGISCMLAGRGAKRIYVFFNNDLGGYAPRNALTLRKILRIE
jgi:uncharacterized protein YecE (DUF72 family)